MRGVCRDYLVMIQASSRVSSRSNDDVADGDDVVV